MLINSYDKNKIKNEMMKSKYDVFVGVADVIVVLAERKLTSYVYTVGFWLAMARKKVVIKRIVDRKSGLMKLPRGVLEEEERSDEEGIGALRQRQAL
ncbi:hypothetical protein TIFTF001_041624 [Ficus carica]|uniref:Uncharacterized protein n=1 Tax=Ficus carica TaxID=3494 RepID=A0AA88CR79_FICCA|nr:hypothetical protein TIFTF001_041621 [Ficus carica]GMN31672.1 hypothetical protein TIFTF001_041622 [Ficus carica]GMN31688.1 hypothetical protein TIFTF001_041623 [Ficus carica]GMN31707.1 hypothetical protein TIFTF001_041624 [Ficus carica]